MKLLFDQNISFRIVEKIKDLFPGSDQVRQLGLEDKTDNKIWLFDRRNGFSIVTFDADFYDISLVKGIPPKIIWHRTGNTSTASIIKLIKDNFEVIEQFISDQAYKEIRCLEIKKDSKCHYNTSASASRQFFPSGPNELFITLVD